MRVCVIGEGMLELSRVEAGWQMGYGGDTLNTAIHLARYGLDVAYVTALGTDPFSDELRRHWTAEGLDTSLILLDSNRQPGLYAIRTDSRGERSFHYWRGDSAARGMFELAGIDTILDKVERADLVSYSLITLAIIAPAARARLFEACRCVRARGGRVAFDGNYRARLWPSTAEARAARDAAAACCDIGLPTLEDEAQLDGAQCAESVARHWAGAGAAEVVVKLGASGCRLPDGSILPPQRPVTPLDTSGAGDAFNAGYLQARLRGAEAREAALAAHSLAAWVIRRSGAIPPRDDEAPY
jgi:2-dehydro-3-deoxygluconokinase